MRRRTAAAARPFRSSLPSEKNMNLHITLGPLLALIAGILILLVPRLLNFIVALYLIIIGVIGIMGTGPFLR